ncbi:MAG: hypothetical protein KHZ05_09045, partial [Oscillospiraceae bacterium]|nr:hypothetical protein [Oscillospiraceae bacterium]
FSLFAPLGKNPRKAQYIRLFGDFAFSPFAGRFTAGDPPPHPAEVAKKQGSRTKRRSGPAGSQDEGKVL